jgi:DNA-directed RNA polymerase specialized sigma24 family protein
MTAETYLDRIKKIDAMIKNKLRDRARWVEIAQGLGCAAVGERVQSSRNLHRGSDAIGNYIDIDREIDALKQERQEIIQTVERLPSAEYDVIYKLYVQDFSMKEVAYHNKRSYDWVKDKKRKGLDILQGILN